MLAIVVCRSSRFEIDQCLFCALTGASLGVVRNGVLGLGDQVEARPVLPSLS